MTSGARRVEETAGGSATAPSGPVPDASVADPPGDAPARGEGTADAGAGHAVAPALLGRARGWLIAGAVYVAASVAMWWQVWSGHPATSMTCACGDPSSFVWFLEWPAYAMTHGQSLFFATRAHVPGGMNLLDNTSVLALGVVLAPVTWLFGPIASLNVALTAAPALTAWATYAVLRRALRLGWLAAFLGGLLFGFSPFMMRNEAISHLQVSFLALVPFIFWACYELAVAQRGRWWVWGLALGLLTALQFFIGLEIFTITAMTTVAALALAVVAALTRPPGTLERKLPFAWRGFALAAGVAGILLAYPLRFALAGPQHIRGSDWAYAATNGLLRVLLPLHQSGFQQHHLPMIGYLGPAGTLGAYLGVPVVIVLAVAAVGLRRPLAMLGAVLTAGAIWLSLGSSYLSVAKGGEPHWLWLPWRIFSHVPVLDKITPANFSAVAAWWVAVAAALVVDRLWQAGAASRVAGASAAGATAAGARVAGATVAGARVARAAAGAVSLALVMPWLFAWPLPFSTSPVVTPSWVAQAGAHLPATAVVLFYPFPSSYLDAALVWQAEQGMRYSVVGGRGIVAGPGGYADHGLTRGTPYGDMSGLSTSYVPHSYLPLPARPTAAAVTAFRAVLRHWGVTDVVMTGGGRDPAYARQWLTAMLGAPPQRQYGAWVWTGVQPRLKLG